MNPSPLTWVCFAVKEEAKFFHPEPGSRVRSLLTGMGRRNAERAILAALAAERPDLVVSAGFAGGLRPGLQAGTVLFAVDAQGLVQTALQAAGARPATFHCAEHVAITSQEKRMLWESTGADAVEMESQVICAICHERNIPCATVRVILDPVEADLPLDFNSLMTPDQRMDNGKLALALLRAPGKIGSLLALQKQSRAAATRLAAVLTRITPEAPNSSVPSGRA